MSATFTSALGNIFIDIQNQLATITDLKFIDLDTGQLEHQDVSGRPAVMLPCALFDFIDIKYETGGYGMQFGSGIVEVRVGVNPFVEATQYFTDSMKQNALKYFDIENEVNIALHGFETQYHSPLQRVSTHTERRNDKLRVRIMRYTFEFTDNQATQQNPHINVAGPHFLETSQGFGIGSV